MSRTDFYEMHRTIHRAEVQELINAVIAFGGEAHFGLDYTGEHATGTERPCVAANVCDGPEDYYINAVSMKDGFLHVYAVPKDCLADPVNLNTDNIEFGHVSFITGAIPDMEDKGEPTLIKTAELTTISGEYILIETDSQHWYYCSSDDKQRLSGFYTTDEKRPFTIVGFDGCSDMPYAVRDALERLGYALEL